MLEGSGVFATYQLQTNYRSNQEILDFANVALTNIEANQYANIQLRANALTPVTAASFQEKVQLDYIQLSRINDFRDELLISLQSGKVSKYIQDKLANNESVTFLAYTRDTIAQIKRFLESAYPDKTIVNLVPEKMFNATTFSDYIRKYWQEVKFIPSKFIMATITQNILAHVDDLSYRKGNDAFANIQKVCIDWMDEQSGIIRNWQVMYENGIISLDDLLEHIKENMLQFEIRRNAVKQAMLSTRNEEAKRYNRSANANFILSTIHSAKGLEFDNVVVIHRNENDMAEDKKRMYYVAFTRAMKSEFVLTYDNKRCPKIVDDYNAIVKLLEAKDAAAAKSAANSASNTSVGANGMTVTVVSLPEDVPVSAENSEENGEKPLQND